MFFRRSPELGPREEEEQIEGESPEGRLKKLSEAVVSGGAETGIPPEDEGRISNSLEKAGEIAGFGAASLGIIGGAALIERFAGPIGAGVAVAASLNFIEGTLATGVDIGGAFGRKVGEFYDRFVERREKGQ